MKHILGMVKPHLDFQTTRVPKAELDYLRLIYAVSQIRKQGENAQGYFIVTDGRAQNRLVRLEQDYCGKEYAQVLAVSLNGYLKRAARVEKTEILSGIVRAAVLDKGDSQSSANIRRSLMEFVLEEMILGLEPDVQRVKEQNRFPFGIHWNFYGLVD